VNILQHNEQPEVELEKRRHACEGIGGGTVTLQCIRLCAANRMVIPDWLATQFLKRFVRWDSAEVGSLDEAFGWRWPKGPKRLAQARERIALRAAVHAWVYRLAHVDNDLSITPELFARIGRMPEINRCASTVGELYYEALREGRPDVAWLRRINGNSNT
jgi:hypothetical protein